jgi:hypothetical protein
VSFRETSIAKILWRNSIKLVFNITYQNGHSPVVDDKIGENKLMRVEQEWCDAEGKDGNPEIDQERCPQGQRDIEQHDQCPHTEIDTRTSKPREQDAEVDPCRRETTTSRDVPRTTKSQIAQNGVGIDLRRKDLENG